MEGFRSTAISRLWWLERDSGQSARYWSGCVAYRFGSQENFGLVLRLVAWFGLWVGFVGFLKY